MRNLLTIALLWFLVGCTPNNTPAAEPAPTPSGTATRSQLTLLTYNVLADPVGLQDRVPALLALIEAQDADVIVLQEVAPWFEAELDAQPWTAAYARSPSTGAERGLLILSRHPILQTDSRALASTQGRGVVVATIEVEGEQLAVGNVHLDSWLEAGPIRAKQLEEVFALLSRAANQSILAGDFNFGDGEQPDTDALHPRYLDAWRDIHPEDDGFTWNMEASHMARDGAFEGEKSRRLDRVLVHSKSWSSDAANIVGDDSVADGEWFPSDHFGLVVKLRKAGH